MNNDARKRLADPTTGGSPSEACVLVALAVAALLPVCAQAQQQSAVPRTSASAREVALALHSELSRTDNASRTSTGKVDDTLASVGANVNFRRSSRNLDLDADGNVMWQEYLENTYDGQALGRFNGNATLKSQSGAFQWIAQETFGQTRIDPAAPDTPDNVESVNYFSTGPRINLGRESAVRVSVFGLYSSTEYEDSAFDSDAWSAGLTLQRGLSSTSSLSLNGTTQRTEFNDALTVRDFDSHQAFVRFEASGQRTQLRADAGYSAVERAGVTSDGLLLRLDLTRHLSARSSVHLNGGRRFSTAADTLRDGRTPEGGISPWMSLSTPDPFQERTLEAGWNVQGARTRLGLSAGWRDERHEQATQLDRTVRWANATLTRRLAESLSLTLSGRLESQGYDQLDVDDDERVFDLSLAKRFGSQVDLSLNLERRDRSSVNPQWDYAENRIGLQVSYVVLGDR